MEFQLAIPVLTVRIAALSHGTHVASGAPHSLFGRASIESITAKEEARIVRILRHRLQKPLRLLRGPYGHIHVEGMLSSR